MCGVLRWMGPFAEKAVKTMNNGLLKVRGVNAFPQVKVLGAWLGWLRHG
jgi:hypothetical protein